MTALAHVEVAPIVPGQLAALLAVAVVVGVPILVEAKVPAARRVPAAGAWLRVVGVLSLAAVLTLVAVGRPGRVLAAAWLILVVGSLAFGPWWREANPLRLLVEDDQPAVGSWPAVVSLAVLLWVSAAPLSGAVVLGVLLVYVAAQLAAGWVDGLHDGIEALSAAIGRRMAARVLLAVPVGVALHTQVVRTGTWRELTAGIGYPWWLGAEAVLAVALIAVAAGIGVGLWPVAAGYVAAWAVTVLLPLPTVIVPDPTAAQVTEALVAAFLPPLLLVAAHGWAARHAARPSIPLAISVVAGTLLFGPW
jgi:hypothetical protein